MKKLILAAAALIAAVICACTASAEENKLHTLSHESGYYRTTQFVRVTSAKGAEVYYTTDGTTPDASDTKYGTEPIIVTENTVIKTAAYVDGELAESNTANIKIRTVSPSASKDSGTYSEAISVKLTCSDKDAEIYYTTDGSTPTKDSKKYTKAITISEDTTLKFMAIGDNLARSPIITRKYTIKTDAYDEPHRQALFEAVNELRAQYGLSPLETLPELDEIAQQRAKEASSYFSHTRPNGTKWYTLLAEAGLKRSDRAENLCYYYATAKAALKSWLNDYSHRSNLLDPDMKYIGIGYYKVGGVPYWSQIFIGD